jgi:transcriptional regulator with XRE-family HTH domain
LEETKVSEDIRLARKEARLTLKEVAAMFGLSREWLRLVEKGEQPVNLERKKQIVQAISRLSALRSTLSVNVQGELKKLKTEIGENKSRFRKVQLRAGQSFKNLKSR